MEEELDIILNAVDNATDTFESVSEAAENMGNAMQDGAEAGTEGFEEVEGAAEGAKDPIGSISDILEGLVGVEVFSQLADALWDVADKAGTFEDSLMRARLEAEGAGIDVNEMTDAVSELSATTGRAGGEIRESFIKATARGVTDMDSFKRMMEGAGAQATLFGTDIQSMADKFSNMAMRSTLMERSLASTGITMEELADAMGMTGATADEVKAKWQELDTNQRAAILGQAATMNEGRTANEEYKKSWAGLQAQLDIAKGRLERLAGEVLLPVLIPALEVAARVLNFLGDTISAVMNGPFGGLVSAIGAVAAGFALVVPAVMAIQGAMALYTASLAPAITATWALLSPWLPFIAIGAAIIAIVYEIGIAFGWWTDVSSMLDAIWAGIQRLWSAFINHPDVQGFLAAMGNAWNAILPYIQSAVSWVMSFFTNTDGSKFDAVRAFIDAVGVAWNAMTLPIRLVITAVRLLITTFTTWYNRARTTINNIRALFAALPGRIRSAISSLVNIITAPFRNAYSGVTSAVNRIKSYVQGLTNINLSGITNAIVKPFTDAYNRVVNEVNKIKAKASELSGGLIALGGEDLVAYGGEGMNVNMKQDINLTLDLKNVPPNIDEATLHAVVVDTLTDKGVISLLVNNDDFQTMDNRVKSRMLARQNRARGV